MRQHFQIPAAGPSQKAGGSSPLPASTPQQSTGGPAGQRGRQLLLHKTLSPALLKRVCTSAASSTRGYSPTDCNPQFLSPQPLLACRQPPPVHFTPGTCSVAPARMERLMSRIVRNWGTHRGHSCSFSPRLRTLKEWPHRKCTAGRSRGAPVTASLLFWNTLACRQHTSHCCPTTISQICLPTTTCRRAWCCCRCWPAASTLLLTSTMLP